MAHFDQVKKHKAVLLAVAGFALFLGAAAFTLRDSAPETATGPLPEIPRIATPELPPETTPSPLTGLPVDPETVNKPITAVMIENSIDARPQSGLEGSGMVFEAIAEGGITRFMAVYQHQEPANFGPIRSARPYYVRWASGLDARFVHSGGSGEALALIPALGVKDLDHGKYGNQLAQRVSTRFAPHNVYTTPGAIEAIGASAGFTSTTYTGIERKDPSPSAAPNASSVAMNISGFNYNTSYTYRAEQNDYLRTMAGQPHVDGESGAQISPEAVIAMEMSYSIHPNGIHSVYGSVGSGSATIFQDGIATQATWNKPSDTAPLTFTDAAGKAVPVNQGQMWLTALQSNRLSYQ